MERAHKKLDVWKEGVNLAVEMYKITGAFPKAESYGLTSQIRRAAVSVPCNIAEGAARSYSKEFVQFLRIADGSLSELETQIEIASRLQFISSAHQSELEGKVSSLGKKLAGLINKVKTAK